MAIIAFDCNRALASHDLRYDAAILLAQTKEAVHDVGTVFGKVVRVTWSNVPSAAMKNFTYVTTTNYDMYMKKKAVYVELLKKKSNIFTEETDTYGLDYYPYKESFFVTVRVEDNALRSVFHESLMKWHIYTIKANKGIRVAVCSLNSERCRGLAGHMEEILDTYKQTHITLA